MHNKYYNITNLTIVYNTGFYLRVRYAITFENNRRAHSFNSFQNNQSVLNILLKMYTRLNSILTSGSRRGGGVQ